MEIVQKRPELKINGHQMNAKKTNNMGGLNQSPQVYIRTLLAIEAQETQGSAPELVAIAGHQALT
jgi:hypothetical protein